MKKIQCALVVALLLMAFQGSALRSEMLWAEDFVGQEASTVQNADSQKHIEETWSPNRKFFARTDSETGVTTVNRVIWQGNVGRFQKFWSAKTGGNAVAISNAGGHLAVAYASCGMIPMDYQKNQALFGFFNKEKPLARIELSAIISDLTRLRKENSGYCWGRCLGLNAAGHYVIETVEGKTILLDMTSGQSEEFRMDRRPESPGCKTFADVMQWYAFEYPEALSMKTYMGDSRIPTEAIFFQMRSQNWLVRAVGEIMPDFSSAKNAADSSFDDFALNRFKAMNCADGPDSSRYIEGIAEKKAFVNPNNLQALELYLTLVDESAEGDERRIDKRTLGPAYAILIAHPGEARRVLFFQMNPDARDVQTATGALQQMIRTVKILR